MAKITKSIRLDLTDGIAEKLNARAEIAGYKSVTAYVLNLIGEEIGEEIESPAWGGKRPDVKLITKMAARMKDDPAYIASLMDKYRQRSDGMSEWTWDSMYAAFRYLPHRQHDLMTIALCRIPRNDSDIRKIAKLAFPDDVEFGEGEVRYIMRELGVDLT